MTDAAQARDLVAALCAGDRRALARLVTHYGRGLTLYCARALSQPHDAEDAAQEVFLRAWTQARSYDPSRAAVSTWLYRIAVNHCIDRNRRHGIRRFLGLAVDEVPDIADDAPGAGRTLAARQTLAAVRLHVAALPSRQGQALLLRVIAEMDTAAIAATLGTGIGAVEQLLVRARATLKARLGMDFTLD